MIGLQQAMFIGTLAALVESHPDRRTRGKFPHGHGDKALRAQRKRQRQAKKRNRR